MKRILLCLVTFSQTLFLIGQVQVEVNIPWSGDKTKATLYEQEIDLPAFPYSFSTNGEICFTYKVEQKGATKSIWQTNVVSIQTAPTSSFDLQYIKEHNLIYTEQLSFKMQANRAREKEYFSFEVSPYIIQNNNLVRVTNVSFSLANQGNLYSNAKEKSFVTTSILKSGDWYQIKISNSGVYKIDKSFLEQLGIQTTGLSSNAINVYGNAMGMLSDYNSDPHPDDLLKNAIQMYDGGDNLFDSQDYFLFYANGPNEKKYVPGYGLKVIKNIYVENSTYFIHIDPSDTPLRVSNAFLSSNPTTQTVSTSNSVATHEVDLSNFVKSGQRWYGEQFDNTLEYTFPFSLNNITSASPLRLYCSFANSGTGSGSTMKVYINDILSQSNGCGNTGGYTAAVRVEKTTTMSVSTANVNIKMDLERSNPSVQAWLDKLELNYEQNLIYINQQLDFRNFSSVGIGNVVEFSVGNSISAFIWEITDPTKPKLVISTPSGGSSVFKVDMDSLRQFIAFRTEDAMVPTAIGKIGNQNLHGLPFAEMLIVTHPDFIDQANRLATLHRNEGMTVNVAMTNQIYNEFSSGTVDPAAIRWFTKMFYDRAAGNMNDMPKYLCLFGDGTYDPKNRLSGNNYKVPTYESESSEDFVASFVSDDYFGLLDNSEAFNGSDLLDVGIGRIVATTGQQAVDMVNKIEHYMKNGSNLFPNQGGVDIDENGYSSTFGDWRLWVTQIADDENGGQFVSDQENYYATYSTLHPVLNGDKIYLDAYKQISVVGGQRYPDVESAINNRIDQGTLVMNYVGHGGETGLALERIVTISQILSWKNINKLPLFISATCEFTRYDDPSRVSAGEEMYLSNQGGAISLMTTTRPVSISGNSIIGDTLYNYLFERETSGKPYPMGEILRLTKNNSPSGNDKRIFTLIGDPALRLLLQPLRIVIDSVNGISPNTISDTLKSLSKVTMKAHVEDTLGNIINGFNGIAYPSVFDKPKLFKTLGQDPDSPILSFQMQKNYLYKGKSTVTNGHFEFSFVVPKDIDYNYGVGKISTYANSTSIDAAGVEKRVVIGGVDPNGIVDDIGPQTQLFMNDETFVNQGLTDENPIFIAKLYDENGINTVGNGIGHDITAILDANSATPIVLNQYYQANLDTYKSGKVRYPMYGLATGKHTITLKVWDVNNNSSDAVIEFTVVKNQAVAIDHVLNYPNPFTTHTEFFFEHNQVDVSLEVQIQIMTITGKLIRTINQYVRTVGYRSEGIAWDGRDDYGDQLAKGVYVYKLSVKAPDGSTANKIEKLVLLK